MINIPPTVETFSCGTVIFCVARAFQIARNFMRNQRNASVENARTVLLEGRISALRCGFRRALSAYFTVSWLAASSNEFEAGSFLDVAFTGCIRPAHAVGAIAALCVFSHTIGQEFSLAWPLVAQSVRMLPFGLLAAFLAGIVELPESLHPFLHALKILVTISLVVFAFLPAYAFLASSLRARLSRIANHGFLITSASSVTKTAQSAYRPPALSEPRSVRRCQNIQNTHVISRRQKKRGRSRNQKANI